MGTTGAGLPRSGPYYVGILAAAAAFGILAARNPALALLAVAGGAFVAIVMEDLTKGLFLFVGVSFLEALPPMIPVVTVAKAVGLLLVGSWALAVATRRRGVPSLLTARPALVALLTLFVLWTAASLLWAREPGPVGTELMRFLPLFALFVIVHAAVRTRSHVTTLALVLIGGAMVSASFGILSPSAPEVDAAPGRLSGAGAGANALAPVLVAGAVLAAAFVGMKSRGAIARFAAMCAGGFCIVGVVLTGSRGGLVGLGVALTVGLIFAGRGRRISVLPVLMSAIALAVLYIFLLAPPILRERIKDPGDGSGRTDIWRVGIEMVEDNFVLGVGAGNFKARSPEYAIQAGLIRRSDLVVDKPRVPHNIYLQVLAQLGVVGLLLFLAIVGTALATVVKAARMFARQKDEPMELLARALFVALCGMLASGFFGSWLFSKPLWLMLAMCPMMLAVARRQLAGAPASASAGPVPLMPPWRRRPMLYPDRAP